MLRLSTAVALAGVIALVFPTLALPSEAWAQPSAGPAIPVAIDLKKVAVGSWSEYSITAGTMPAMKQRLALVARDPASHSVEMTMEGGPMAAAGKMTVKVVLGANLAKPDRVKKMVMQIGENDPMEMPNNADIPKNQFAPLDPKKPFDRQEIKVAAGTFKTKHYRDTTPGGDVVEFWVSDDAPPFGLVKVQGTMKNQPGATGPLTLELTARGKGASPIIKKPAVPFDQAVLMGQMMGKAGAPPPAAPPSVVPRPAAAPATPSPSRPAPTAPTKKQ